MASIAPHPGGHHNQPTDHTSHTDHDQHNKHIGYKVYIAVAVVLAAFTLLEVWIGGTDTLSRFWIVVGLLGLAAIKAILVAAFYMHVLYESRILIGLLLIPLLLALLFGLILAF
jgi:cytochrome c oxidase subunit IV